MNIRCPSRLVHYLLNHALFAVQSALNVLLDSASRQQIHNVHIVLLPDTMQPVFRLHLVSGCPHLVKEDNSVGCCQSDTHASRLRG